MPSINLNDEHYNTFFLTLKIVNDLNVFTSKKYFDIILNSLGYCQKNKGMHILAFAILSNHLHLIFWIDEKVVLKDLVRDFKHFTASQILKQLKQDSQEQILKIFNDLASKAFDRNYKVWRRTTHPEVLYSDKFLEQKIKYVDFNATHHNLTDNPEEYLYTSYHNHYCKHEPVLKLL